MIVKGRELGFTLAEIADLIASNSLPNDKAAELNLDQKTILRQLEHLGNRRAEIDLAIKELQAALQWPKTKKLS